VPETILGPEVHFFDRQFGVRGQSAKHWPVQHYANARGPWQANQIAGLPVRSQQAAQQGVALQLQAAQLLYCHLEHVGVWIGAPPLLVGGNHFGRATARIERVDIRNDDVADGLFRAADVAEVGDIRWVIWGFDLLPSEKLPSDHCVGAYRGWSPW